MSDATDRPETLPAADQASPVTKAEADKAANALKVMNHVRNERARRLSPLKMKAGDEPNTQANDGADAYDWARLVDTFAVADSQAANLLMQTLLESENRSVRRGDQLPTNGLLALVHALEPKDAAESMLCCQMVLTHMQIMECQSRANIEGQTFDGRDVNLRHAERFTRIYTQQLDALNKHRGKGQQKVTVEHVTVNEGGQAVVGSVGR